MGAIASKISSLTIVYSIVYSDADQRKHQSSASLAFMRGIHRGPVNSPYKWPVTRKMFPFDDVIMRYLTRLRDKLWLIDTTHLYRSYWWLSARLQNISIANALKILHSCAKLSIWKWPNKVLWRIHKYVVAFSEHWFSINHYLDQWRLFVSWVLGNRSQLSLNQNTMITRW